MPIQITGTQQGKKTLITQEDYRAAGLPITAGAPSAEAYQAHPSEYQINTVTAPITGADLIDQPRLDLPSQPGEPDYKVATAGIFTSAYTDVYGAEPSKAETRQADISARVLELAEKYSGKQAGQIKAEEAAGLPGYQKQLSDVNAQLQALQKEQAAIPLQIQQEFQGRGATTAGVAPIEAGRLRENAIRSLGLSAIAQTLQGNVALAQSQANRAVELEFGSAQSQLDFLKLSYDMNKDELERQDKKKADLLAINLADKQEKIDEQKENKKIIYAWAAEASKNGAPQVLINQALQINNPQQALGMLSQYFRDPTEKQKELAELEQTQLQNAQMTANLEKFMQMTPLELKKAQSDLDLSAIDRKRLETDIRRIEADISLIPLKKEALKADLLATYKGIEETQAKLNELTSQSSPEAKQSAIAEPLAIAQTLLNSAYRNQVFGLKNPFSYWTPGSNEQMAKAQRDQLIAHLSLENRKKLRGTGTISDFEAKTLERASTILTPMLSDKDAETALKQIVGVFSTAAGGSADVQITDPKTGEIKFGSANRDSINKMILDGLLIEYK